jgi:hypothetical protein
VAITVDADTGFNANFMSALKSYMFVMLDEGGTKLEEWPVDSFVAATRVITLDLQSSGTGDLTDPVTFRAGVGHHYRIVSRDDAERMDQIVTDRLGLALQSELRVLPGSSFNGAARRIGTLNNEAGDALNGLMVDESLAEPEPAKMNLYEALINAELTLESTELDLLVVMDAYSDDPALDGQTVAGGETVLPTEILSDAGGAGIASTTETIAGEASYLELRYASTPLATSAWDALEAAGRGGAWFVAVEAQAAIFGNNLAADEINRTARILNWEASTPEIHTVTAVADIADSLDGTYMVVPYDTDKAYKVWIDTDDSGTAEPALSAADATTLAGYTVTAVEVTGVVTGDAATVVATAIHADTLGLFGVTVTINGADVIFEAHVPGGLLDAFDASVAATGFTSQQRLTQKLTLSTKLTSLIVLELSVTI